MAWMPRAERYWCARACHAASCWRRSRPYRLSGKRGKNDAADAAAICEAVTRPSTRFVADKLLEPEYPDRFEVRLVSGNGGGRWHQHWVNVTSVLVGENIGFEEVADSLWDVYFGPLRIGRFHEGLLRIEDSLGKLKRRV